MSDDHDDVDKRLEALRKNWRVAPGPEGAGFPEWTREGVEHLADFFNDASEVWDRKYAAGYQDLHHAVGGAIPETEAPIDILDIGCGTGLEFEYIFERAPNARLTGLDQAPGMLAEARRKYADRETQITYVEASCLDASYGEAEFDVVVSVLTVHHFTMDRKREIYRKIHRALRSGGIYIEGDQTVSGATESNILDLYTAWIAKLPGGDTGAWNYDITLSLDSNARLLSEAGFRDTRVVWKTVNDKGSGHAVVVASR